MKRIRLYRRYLLVLFDIMVVMVSYFLVAILTDSTSGDFDLFIFRFKNTVMLAIFFYLFFQYAFNSYKNIWSFAGIRQYGQCILGCVYSLMVIAFISMIFSFFFLDYRNNILALAFIITGFLGVRSLIKTFFSERKKRISKSYGQSSNNSGKNYEKKNVLIIGAGRAGCLLLEDMYRRYPEYNIVGFIDDDKEKRGFKARGIAIAGGRNSIKSVCSEKAVDLIILAIPSISAADRNDILNICNQTNCQIKVLPNNIELLNTENILRSVRNVQVEDLLARDTIRLDNYLICEYLSAKTILVTGGGGSIGSELCRQIANFKPARLLILDIYENNAYDLYNELRAVYKELNIEVIIASIRDNDRLEEVFDRYRPQIVFHAAAHKHVPLMECNSSEAIKNNVLGTLNTAKCSHKYRVKKFIMISTDKAVNPTSVMGATKRICEMIVQSIDTISKTEFVAVRFGNVLGSNGSVVNLFKRQIEAGQDITLTHREITRFFMTIPEAAQLVLEAASYATGGEIFVLDMGQPIKIYDLAVNLIKLSGLVLDKDIKIVITGLRRGEKLYEEILIDKKKLAETFNEKIFVEKPINFDFRTIESEIKRLKEIANLGDDSLLRRAIKSMVPTYSCQEVEEEPFEETNVI